MKFFKNIFRKESEFVTDPLTTPTHSLTKEIVINSVQIGNQIWMAENLSIINFRDGTAIDEANSGKNWNHANKHGKPAFSFNKNTDYMKQFGFLYNGFTIKDLRNIAPEGWHIPTLNDWQELVDYAGGWRVAGRKLKSEIMWEDGGNGVNEFGFNGFPVGNRTLSGIFNNNGSMASYWTSTSKSEGTLCSFGFNHDTDYCIREDELPLELGLSIRCIKEDNK